MNLDRYVAFLEKDLVEKEATIATLEANSQRLRTLLETERKKYRSGVKGKAGVYFPVGGATVKDEGVTAQDAAALANETLKTL